jgi:hypothetical protein
VRKRSLQQRLFSFSLVEVTLISKIWRGPLQVGHKISEHFLTADMPTINSWRHFLQAMCPHFFHQKAEKKGVKMTRRKSFESGEKRTEKAKKKERKKEHLNARQ